MSHLQSVQWLDCESLTTVDNYRVVRNDLVVNSIGCRRGDIAPDVVSTVAAAEVDH